MELVIFEENKPQVLQALDNGEFDYIEAASEVFETDFFRYINAKPFLKELAQTFPTPRCKEEVPVWFYIASNLSMRLHGVHSFNAYPMVVRAGGMLNAFGFKSGRKVIHPETGEVTLSCEGFNQKNHYDREIPCDKDYLRKMSKDTEAQALLSWFGRDVVKVFRRRRAFDKAGIFIGDASYLFVPDNPNYEGSVKLLFDEHNHPISRKTFRKLRDEQKARCQWRRCYKMVTLLHTNPRLEYFLFVAVKVVAGNSHECPILYALVKEFVEGVGKKVMKRLILDRGFLDGKAIATCKEEYGIDVLIPVRKNMDIYDDAMALFQLPEVKWIPYEQPTGKPKKPSRSQPKTIRKREKNRQKKLQDIEKTKEPPPSEKTVVKSEVAAVSDFRTWTNCTVPLTVVATRDLYADGHQQTWLLLDTKDVKDPRQSRCDYKLRTSIEERYRQLKGFSDLTHFTSRAFSMVVNQVVFILLAYNLLQLYLLRQGRKELNKKTSLESASSSCPRTITSSSTGKTTTAFLPPLNLSRFFWGLAPEPRRRLQTSANAYGVN